MMNGYNHTARSLRDTPCKSFVADPKAKLPDTVGTLTNNRERKKNTFDRIVRLI